MADKIWAFCPDCMTRQEHTLITTSDNRMEGVFNCDNCHHNHIYMIIKASADGRPNQDGTAAN